MTKKCAERIINEIPEIKGVLKGDIKQTVGMKDSNSSPHVYKLLAGCDMRCDIVLTFLWCIMHIQKSGRDPCGILETSIPKSRGFKKSY